MKSVLDMLAAIIANPNLDFETRTRAGFLHSRLSGGGFFSIFGGLS